MADGTVANRAEAQQREYDEALAYLQREGDLEDQWILEDRRSYFRLATLAERMGLTAQTIRQLVILGVQTDGAEGIPGGAMNGEGGAWQVSHRGVAVYLARVRKALRNRAAS